MQRIEIYTSSTCGYCFAAKRLLNQKGVSYEEINIQMDPERRAEMIARAAGQRSVPQSFFGALCCNGHLAMNLTGIWVTPWIKAVRRRRQGLALS